MPTPQQAEERVVYMPFHMDETGGVTYATKIEQLAVQEIQAILLTAQGERVMRPGVGSPFPAQLFAPINSTDTAYIISELLDLLGNACRYSTVRNLRVNTSQLGVFGLSVEYSPIMHDVVLVADIPFSTVFSSPTG